MKDEAKVDGMSEGCEFQTPESILSRADPCRSSDPADPLAIIQRDNWSVEKATMLAGAGFGRRHRQPFVSRSAEWDAALGKVVAKLRDPMGSLLFLCGNRGNGKTQLTEKAMEFYLDQIYEPQKKTGRPLYDRAMGFYLEVRAAFKTGATRTELSALLPYIKAGLLVLDEIHVRGETDWENRLLTHMLDCRYADCLHTILISNLGRDAMVASVGESVADRLRETGGVIECTWPSFRGAA
jgi:hypothetical protein